MSRAFKRLERVLRLEQSQGYQNKAVVGGIRQFVTFWVNQAREEELDEADKALVEQTAELLADYGRLPGVEARAAALEGLLARLEARQQRQSRQNPPPRPARQDTPPPAGRAERPARQRKAPSEAGPREERR